MSLREESQLPASKTTTKLAGRQTSSGEISLAAEHMSTESNTPSLSVDPPDDIVLTGSVSGEAAMAISPSSEDEEIQLAKAMILAMQSNPNATPDEIHAMLAKQGMQRASFTASKESSGSQPLIPGRLMANLMGNSFDLSSSISWDKARKGLDEMLTEGVSKLEEVGSSLGLPSSKPPVPPPIHTNHSEDTEKTKPAGGLKRSFTGRSSKILRTPPISPVSGEKPVITQTHSDAQFLSLNKDSKAKAEYPVKAPPIRLSGLAWKRRGGMGKFSSTAAWERRRIELQGGMLLYYLRDASEEVSQTGIDYISPTKSLSADEDQSPEGVVVTKRATWLEQAAHNWIAGSEDPTAPRGYIDLVKEKATVQASTGDSGCPSPFAISVKVRGETKWKLCFDHHRAQMEWLVAITDIVVQSSVDQYNALLLQAADPAHQTETAVFRPPSVEKPPSKDNDKSQRLWMTEPYTVSSFNGGRNEFFEGSNTERTSSEDMGGSEMSRVAESQTLVNPDVDVAVDLANLSDNWKIPEKHLLYVFGVINVSLIYARASSTSLDGFWYLVSLANLGVYLCLSKDISRDARLIHAKVSKVVATEVKAGLVDGVERKLPSVCVARTEGIKGFIPKAGTTTVRIENSSDPPVNDKNEHFVGWMMDRGDSLLVRSHGYLSTKKKVPSPGELYECVHMDAFESPHRYPDMGTRVQLPKVEFDDGDVKKTWRAPDIFIVSIALPTDPPKLGSSSSDGGGYTITGYFRMKQETRDILKRVTAEGYDASSEKVDDPQKSQVNAVRLFEEWCRRAPTDGKFQARFKIVPNAHNLKEIGMPGWIAKYNGTPFLIKRPGQTGFLFVHPELSCIEFDVSLHVFPYLAKQAICFMKESFFKKTLVTFGFVIEGRADDELPECLIGLFQLCYPDPKYAIQAADFFSGAAQRSF